MTTPSAPAPKNAGFTLVEVMVSMTLLSVASLLLHPITTSFTRTISGNGNPLRT